MDKIIKGEEAEWGQFPYHVLLRIRRKNMRIMTCGGSILNEHWILTAAHCVSQEKSGNSYIYGIEVTAGINDRLDRSLSVQKRSVDCVLIHDKWIGLYGGFANDLALLRIPDNKPLNITHRKGGNVNGVCLPLKSTNPYEYIGKARISGWGFTEKGKSSMRLKFTDVGLIDDDKCQKNSFSFAIVNSMLCQGSDTTSPCFGDSGGPLVVRLNGWFTQIGVVSTGPSQCANSKDPNAIYTQVSHFLDWIENTISRNSELKCFGVKLSQFE